MVKRMAISGIVMMFLIMASTPCVDAGTTQIHVTVEEGGPVFNSNNGTTVNERGTIFWNGTAWMTSDTAAHMYFTYSIDNTTRVSNYSIDAIKGGDAGMVRNGNMRIASDNFTYSVTVSRYQYELDINGSAWTVDAYQYEISTSDWKAILQSRSDGVVNGTSFFHAFISNASGNTMVMREGVDMARMSVGIDQALVSPAQVPDYRLGGGNNSNYWFDIGGGSDMGGITYQVITGKIKMNGTLDKEAISNFMVNFQTYSTGGHKIAFEPSVQLSSSVGKSDIGTNGNSSFDLLILIGMVALVLLVIMAFVLARRNKKKE